jgi:hypothetical protein
MIFDIDITKVDELLTSMEELLKEYDKYIDEFFKEIISNNAWIGDASKKYVEYVTAHAIEYSNYSEAFKKFIKTTRYSINELEGKVLNNEME